LAKGKFVTAINCMDGRTQLPVIEFLKQKYKADYVDSVTEPGPIKILSEKSNRTLVESIRSRVAISVEKHGSKVVGVVGHFDCAGNPVDKTQQLSQLDDAVSLIESWGLDIEVIKLWVDENWQTFQV
jgi:microsomal dipeptidase-like Zn-dependent dipeptidase